MEQSIRNHNMKILLELNGNKSKKRCKLLTFKDPQQWNWFIDESTACTNRGVIFNLQMCLYLKQILRKDKYLNSIYNMEFFSSG